MTAPLSNSWQTLFAADNTGGKTETVELRIVKRKGDAFLVLPADPHLAIQTLQLYAAQSFRARLAKKLLTSAIQKRRGFMSSPVSLPIALNDPFIHFLQNFAHWPDSTLPAFGILNGNPTAAGRRFILLLFNPKQSPAAVVKVGTDEAAKQLIETEANFLASVPSGPHGIPVVRARFEHARLRAMATDFFEGASPGPEDEAGIPALLTSWFNRNKTIAIGFMRPWWQLQQCCADHPVFARLAERLPNQIVRPTIFHGDFAPWNCKVANGGWRVLDWERGDLHGLPGYDWLHYIVQTRILVAKKSTSALVKELEQLLDSEDFREYARRGGFLNIRRELLLMYLLHHNEVIRPGQGLEKGRKLLDALAA